MCSFYLILQPKNRLKMNKKSLVLLLFAFISPLFATAQCYTLVWSDEFGGSTLNAANWSYEVGAGGWGNNELQYYTNGANVQVSNGTLKILAKQEFFGGAGYTSSRIITRNKVDFRYGKFEARLKLPQGQGLWPAFWLMPTESAYGNWPRSGEIDIMELLGQNPAKAYGTIHTGDPNNTLHSYGSNYTLSSGTFANGFHIFTLEWTPTDVKWLIDGTVYFTKTNSEVLPWVFDKTFHILLNVAVGGNWPGAPDGTTVFPQTMEVDFVRIYHLLPDVQIQGATLVEPSSSAVYTLPNMTGTTYAWSGGTNATISSGQGTAQTAMAFGLAGNNTTLSATISNGCGTATPQYAVTVSPNQWSNPDFENDLSNWNSNAYNGGSASFAIITANPQQATKALCATVSSLGVDPWNVQLSRTPFNVTAGQSYTLSYWAKGDVASRPYNFSFINATNYTYYAGSSRTTTANWVKQTYTFTPSVSTSVLFTIDIGIQTGMYCFDNFVFGKTELVVPVELIDFQAIAKNKAVDIEWRVAQEIGLKNYEIQRSQEGISFETIGLVAVENRNANKKYIFEDIAPLTNIGFYRLKINEQDGVFSYSKIQSVKFANTHFDIFPNPTHDFIDIKNIENAKSLELFDQNGRLLRDFSNEKTNRLDLRDLPKGVYLLKVQTGGAFLVFKVVKM